MYYVDDYGRASSRSLVNGYPGGFDDVTGWQGTAPAPTDIYKYIWKRSRLCNPNTTPPSYGAASYVCLTGEDGEPGGTGDDGADAVNVVVSPASMIVEQDINNKDNIAHASDNNLGQFSIQVLKGSTACTITSITASASQVYMSNSPSTGDYTGDNCRTWQPNAQIANMYLKGIAKDSSNNYYTTGDITLSITYTDPDTNTGKTISNIIVKVYMNLIGSWSESVIGDMKHEVATAKFYFEDEDGNVVAHETIGDYIKSSTENISTLTEKSNNGKNMLTGTLTGTGWKSNNTTAFAGMHDITVDIDGWFNVASGDSYIVSPSFTLENGKTYIFSYEQEQTNNSRFVFVVYDNAGTPSQIANPVTKGSGTRKHISFTGTTETAGKNMYIFVKKPKIIRPQLETGSEATEFESGGTEVSSQISQTAREISMVVKDEYQQAGLTIVSSGIELMGGKVDFTGSNGTPYIKVSVDSNGMPHLIFLAPDGVTEMYDLGYTGLAELTNNSVPDRYTALQILCAVGNTNEGYDNDDFINPKSLYYRRDTNNSDNLGEVGAWFFTEGYTLDGQGNRIYTHSGTSTPSNFDQSYNEQRNYTSHYPAGWYFVFGGEDLTTGIMTYRLMHINAYGVVDSEYAAYAEHWSSGSQVWPGDAPGWKYRCWVIGNGGRITTGYSDENGQEISGTGYMSLANL